MGTVASRFTSQTWEDEVETPHEGKQGGRRKRNRALDEREHPGKRWRCDEDTSEEACLATDTVDHETFLKNEEEKGKKKLEELLKRKWCKWAPLVQTIEKRKYNRSVCFSVELLVCVFRHLPYRDRLRCMEVCQIWNEAGNDPTFRRRVKADQSIQEALDAAGAGDTLLIEPSFYEEQLSIRRPVKLVGLPCPSCWGSERLATVVQSPDFETIDCRARCCIERMILRSTSVQEGKSLISFGRGCEYLKLEHCEISGLSGILLPVSTVHRKLCLKNTKIHSTDCDTAICIEGGSCLIQGCTVTGNSGTGITVGPYGFALVKNCDVSFNHVGLSLSGSGQVKHNIVWGNRYKSFDYDPDHSCELYKNQIRSLRKRFTVPAVHESEDSSEQDAHGFVTDSD